MGVGVFAEFSLSLNFSPALVRKVISNTSTVTLPVIDAIAAVPESQVSPAEVQDSRHSGGHCQDYLASGFGGLARVRR